MPGLIVSYTDTG